MEVILAFLLANILASSTATSMFKAPDITIDGWSALDDFKNWNITTKPELGQGSNDSVFIVPHSIGGMSLICNSTRPVEWSFHREKWNRRTSWQTMITTTRESDLSTPNLDPLWYTAEVRFIGGSTEITGNYTCQQYGQPDISRSVYIYWEGSSPPYLTLLQSGGGKRTVIFDPKRSNSFKLPCTISRPDVIVNLNKTLDKNTTVILPLNDSIKFDPAIGFTLTDLPDPLGEYQCSVGDIEDNDAISFEVVSGDSTQSEFNNRIWSSASFKYDATKREFVCCSSSKKPPKMVQYFCSHPISCKLRKHALHNMETPRRRKVDGNCSKISMRYIFGGGVLRCVGENIDIVREFFFPILQSFEWSSNVEPYYSWSDADPDKMMSLTNLTRPFYIGETVRIYCQVSPFYFSQGIQWGLKYKNETSMYIRVNQTNVGRHQPFGLFHQGNSASISITAEEGLYSVTCHAPIWNTTEWRKKTNIFNIKKPIPPSIEGLPIEEQNWRLNDTDKVLTCKFDAIPKPRVIWKKGNRTVYRGLTTVNGTSTLKVPRVGLEAHGKYSCNVSNVGGIAVKIFNVYVSAPVSTEVVALYIFAALCIIGAGVGAFFGIKKMKEQKDKIRRLANVAFKEVTDGVPNQQPSQQGPTTFNQTPTPNSQAPAILSINGLAGNGFFNEAQNDIFANGSTDATPTSDFGRYQKM